MWSDRTARGLFAGIAMGMAMSLVACHATGTSGSEDEMDLVSQAVTISGYNYTGRALNDIVVDGAWMGGADAFSMSGSAAGLMAPRDRTRQHSVKLRWEVRDYYDIRTNKYLRPAPPPEPHEAVVPIKFPYPEHIENLVLHFYPDGHVEAEFAEFVPPPRIAAPEGFHR